MIKKRDFVGFVLVTYLILLTLFFAVRDNESSQDISVCTHRVACVRFCCHDHESCSTKFLKTNFNKSLIPADEDGEVEDFKYFFGKPDCPILEPLEMKWKFTSVKLRIFEFRQKNLNFRIILARFDREWRNWEEKLFLLWIWTILLGLRRRERRDWLEAFVLQSK